MNEKNSVLYEMLQQEILASESGSLKLLFFSW